MIPYIQINTISLGFITIQFWGLMVALGFVIGIYLSFYRAKKKSIDSQQVLDLAFWILIVAMLMGRVFHVFVYHWWYYSKHLGEIVRVWEGGMSSLGGFVGALIVVWFFVYKKKLNFFKYADTVIWGLPLGMAVGRIGCAFIHDHPGIGSDFWLAVNYPGGARHDLGLYLVLLNLFIWALFLFFDKKPRFNGFFFALYLLVYGVGRFFLDFLRIWQGEWADTRFLFLTPMQYGAIAMVFVAIFIYTKKRNLITAFVNK